MANLRNFKLVLEYDGTEFSGWQTQSPGFRTVQSHVEEKLERIFKCKVHCHASGRTDSGVHAMGQVAHVKVDTALTPTIIHKALNSFLDRDVSVTRVVEVPLDFHAQHSVKLKTYRYTILNRPSPSALWRNRAYFLPHKLNIALMRKAARHLKGTHDFKSFQAAPNRTPLKNTVRTITRLSVTKEGELVHITITSNGFLYNMVRILVGTLIAVGRGKIKAASMPQMLKSKNRNEASPTAPSNGLCLMSVRY